MREALVFLALILCCGCLQEGPAPTAAVGGWVSLESGTDVSLRGLHVVNADVVWASGANGTVLRSVDAGETWESGVVPGAEELDLRDIHAWDRDRAVVLSAGLPAQIHRTDDGGASWDMTYLNSTPGVFFNAMSFWDENRGIAVGDPIDGRFLLVSTDDGGRTWSELPWSSRPEAIEGEANFAASGTCLTVHGENAVFFGTGGPAARVFRSRDGGASWDVSSTPVRSGEPSQGVFSVHLLDEARGVVVGGDYRDEPNPASTAAVTTDGGVTWKPASSPPSGFRECVVAISDTKPGHLMAVGPAGTDVSFDGGSTWDRVGEGQLHAAGFSRDGTTGIAVGVDGLVCRWRH